MEGNNFKLKDSTPKTIFSIKETHKNFNIAFHNDKSEIIGKLYIENDVMKFEGEAEESAKIFFEYVIKQYLTSSTS